MKEIIKLFLAVLALILMCVLFFIWGICSCDHTNLTKEIDRLKPYEENFKILADSIVDCHRHCFTIGQ
jgi:hypothetical protein